MINSLVSVIIPNYNHALYIEQRIQSVLHQTYKNLEIIILDDNSLDNSVDIINKYKDNPKVAHIIVNEKNSGSTFVQWNLGFNLAKGDIIWIAESDDYCDPEFLETCLSEYTSDPNCVVAYCSSEYVDANNNDLGTYNHYDKLIYNFSGPDFIKQRMAFGCAIWNASAAIFSRKVALSIDCQYQSYKACGDKLFWIEMAEKGNVIHINKTLNYFRQHNNKVSPKRFRDGTSLQEEYDIYKYQCSKGYLYGIRRAFVLNLYFNKIMQGSFDSEYIKKKLVKLWGFDNKIKMLALSSLSRLYQHFCLYILHSTPL